MKKIRIFALLAACVMFISAYLLIKDREEAAAAAQMAPELKTVTRMVAAVDIKPYTVLTAAHVVPETLEVPAEETVTGIFEKAEDLVGRVAYSDIFKGEVITQNRALEATDEKLGLSMQIAEGMRAVTVKVDSEQAVGYNLQVGNRVDIIYTTEAKWDSGLTDPDARVSLTAGQGMSLNYGDGNPANVTVIDEDISNTVSILTVQNVRVLAVSNTIYRTESPGEYNHITLEVTPEEASQITLMEKTGTLRIVLRAPGDEEIISAPRTGILTMHTEDPDAGMEFFTAEVTEPETEAETAEEAAEAETEEEEAPAP